MMDWLTDVFQGFVDWLHDLFLMLLNFLKDLFLFVFEMLMDGIVYMFTKFQPPVFLTNGVGTLFEAVPSDILYFLNMSAFSTGLAIFGAGVSFRMLRKLVTLGQW